MTFCVVAVNEDFQVMDSTGSTDAPAIDAWQRGSRDCRCADVHHSADNDKTKKQKNAASMTSENRQQGGEYHRQNCDENGNREVRKGDKYGRVAGKLWQNPVTMWQNDAPFQDVLEVVDASLDDMGRDQLSCHCDHYD